jgi:hypothetical protein
MTVNLLRYMESEPSPQPEVVTATFKRLCTRLRDADSLGWEKAIHDHIAETRDWITTGLVDGINAGGAVFVAHALQAGYRALGREGGARVLGWVLQLSLTQAEWAGALKAMAAGEAGGRSEEADDVLRLGGFPTQLLGSLVRRGQHDILRELFRTRLEIDDVARRAMEGAHDFESWVGDLAVLAAYLTARRWLPLRVAIDGATDRRGEIELHTTDGGGITGGRFVPPEEMENPILAQLFESSDIQTLHRKEAYAAECFAHLFTSVVSGFVTTEHQHKACVEYAARASQSRIDAREWLALSKSRFEVAPYLRAS